MLKFRGTCSNTAAPRARGGEAGRGCLHAEAFRFVRPRRWISGRPTLFPAPWSHCNHRDRSPITPASASSPPLSLSFSHSLFLSVYLPRGETHNAARPVRFKCTAVLLITLLTGRPIYGLQGKRDVPGDSGAAFRTVSSVLSARGTVFGVRAQGCARVSVCWERLGCSICVEKLSNSREEEFLCRGC